MNKTYRSIWNDVRNCFVVVGENARSKGKPASARKPLAALVAALFLAPAAALAVPCAGPSPVSTALTTPQCYGDQNVTINSSGSIIITTPGGNTTTAAYVSAPYTSTFTNNGTIRAENPSGGWNYANGLYFSSDLGLAGKLNNTGTISGIVGGNSGSAYGVYVNGNLSGSLTNSGTISATVNVNQYSAFAYGAYVSGDLSGSLTNSGTISASATTPDSSYASAYGVLVTGNLSGTLTNTGTISAVANNDSDSAYAHGVNVAGALSGTLNNAGTISATANQSSSDAYAYGVYAGSIGATGKLINSGTISATANSLYPYYAEAYGVYVSGSVAAGGEITNSKTISATAKGGDGSSIYAYGVYVGGDLAGSLTNTSSGTISATANTIGSTSGYLYAFGVHVGGDLSGTLSNAGTITATASGAEPYTAYAYGVYVGNALSGTLNNSGTISATAAGSTSYAYAFGVHVGGDLSGTLTNSGTISATATVKTNSSAYAYGVYVGSDLSGTLTNSGTITATAKNLTSYTAYAYGVLVSGNLTGNLTNSGTISATATAVTSYAYAVGVYVGNGLSGTLTNSGTISATASVNTDSSAYAYGVYVGGDISGTLTNSGTITATANNITSYSAYAYGVYAGDVSGTLSNSGTISASANAPNDSWAYAYGVYVNGNISGILTNSGTISAVANGFSGGSAYGVYAGTLDGTLNNSGTISAKGLGGVSDSNVYSVYASSGAGTINNLAGGVLDGQVYAGGAVSLNNAGTIDTRLNGSYVGGDYTQAATGALTVGALNAGSYGSLTVGGTATLAAGTGIQVNVGSGNTLVATDVLTNVISAGTLTMTTVNVMDNLLSLQFAASNNGTGVDLTASATGLTSVAAATAGTSGAGAGVVLDSLLANIGSQPQLLQDYLYSLGSAGTQQGVSNAVAQILPLISGGVTQVALGAAQGTNRVVQARQEGKKGRSSGDQFYGDQRFWLKPFGSWANQDNHNGVSGYDATTYGLVVGADAEVKEAAARLGVAFGYSRSDVDGNSSVARQSADVDSYNLVIYGSHDLDPATDVNFQVGVGRHETDGRRRITFGGTSLTAKSDYHSWSRSIGAGIARTMAWSDKTSFTPSVRADYAWIRDKSYGESGAGALNLNVGTNKTEQFIIAADGKFTHALSDLTTLTGNLGVGYDLINDRGSISSTMAGAPTAAFATKGIDSSPWMLRGGAGMVYRAAERTEVTARYDIEGREDYTNQTASVKVRWAF